MTTLQELYMNDPASDAYHAKRAAAVREIADYLDGRLKPGIDALKMAESVMDSAEEMGRIDGDEVNGEVPGRYTLTGNPLVI